MTASDRREAIIDAAKDDARQAVDLLLDAIGRILLAHIDAHDTTTSPAPVKPSKPRKGVTNTRPAVARSATQQMLAALIAKDEQDMLLDADGQTRDLDEPYIVNGEALMYPGDPNGSAANIIQCRCTETYEEAQV